MKIYIVRHGEVNHNVNKIYSNLNEDLNENGIKQAELLKDKIKNIDYDIIISSPLNRAEHTAQIINVKNKVVIYDDRLKERDPGDLNGKPISFTNRNEYWNFDSKIQYGTSENMKIFFNRVFSFLEDLKKEEYNSVLIVAHSGVSKAFSAYFQGIKNCEMKEYEI